MLRAVVIQRLDAEPVENHAHVPAWPPQPGAEGKLFN